MRSLSILVVSAAIAFPGIAAQQPEHVDCSKGQSINKALKTNADPLEIEFSGTCAEDVLIARDRVSLRGTGSSPMIVGASGVPFADRQPGILLRGASDVLLAGFTVHDTDSRAIEARGSSALAIENVLATGSRTGLLLVEQSSALVRNSSFDGNTGDGIGVWDNSALMLEGAITANGNTRVGIIASGGSSLTVAIAGASTTANNNLLGYLLQLGAQALMSSASPTTTTASGNGSIGLAVSSESHWSGGATVSNSVYGITVEAAGSFFGPSGRISVSSCETGLYVAQDSQMTVV